eukprot:m.55759 g.55759  ORF g.55759 m.55759 type:complete len:106 (+) comp7769_c0_seq1:318-635(+)
MMSFTKNNLFRVLRTKSVLLVNLQEISFLVRPRKPSSHCFNAWQIVMLATWMKVNSLKPPYASFSSIRSKCCRSQSKRMFIPFGTIQLHKSYSSNHSTINIKIKQ